MEAVLVCCDACGARLRLRRPDEPSRERRCPRCFTPITLGGLSPSIALQAPTARPAAGPRESDVPKPFAVAALAMLLATVALSYVGVRSVDWSEARRSPRVDASEPAASRREFETDQPVTAPLFLSASPSRDRTGRTPAERSAEKDADPTAAQVSSPPRESIEASASLAAPALTNVPPPEVRPKEVSPPRDLSQPALPAVSAIKLGKEAQRIRVRLQDGRTVVARVHGPVGGETHIMLPDGQLGIPDRLVLTDQPFVPATPGQIADDLRAGRFSGFEVHRTAHYVILYHSTAEFAEESGKVLESLYRGLTDAFRKRGIPVEEAEFPLVAVIFHDEREFREHKPVAPEVQAYYEIYTNRIYFYQTSERDDDAPEIAAVRRPQTVAHEGTHQILQNIGVQPRLADWPLWLIEGLAEYCATPKTTKEGATWGGLGMVNAQHLATIRDLNDPKSRQVPGSSRPAHIGRPSGMPLVEYLITKTDLTPTDYALAWAVTHYLAMKRTDEFVAFLQSLSAMKPLERKTPADQLSAFRAAFGDNLAKFDREVGTYLSKLRTRDHLPYYAVMFQQQTPGGMLKRAAIVSQSPSMIRQWLDTMTVMRGDPPVWEAVPHPSRTRAFVTASQWMRGS